MAIGILMVVAGTAAIGAGRWLYSHPGWPYINPRPMYERVSSLERRYLRFRRLDAVMANILGLAMVMLGVVVLIMSIG